MIPYKYSIIDQKRVAYNITDAHLNTSLFIFRSCPAQLESTYPPSVTNF